MAKSKSKFIFGGIIILFIIIVAIIIWLLYRHKRDVVDRGCPSTPRTIKIVNNCNEDRWFKFDGKTTPMWVKRPSCPWSEETCSTENDVVECMQKAKKYAPNGEAGVVYCRNGKCACNPSYHLKPGEAMEFTLPDGVDFPSGTGWLASGCNKYGEQCKIGNDAARNSTFEFTYDGNFVWYDISAVNSWTSVSPVGMKSCGVDGNSEEFWCKGTGCNFDPNTQCPDGTGNFPSGSSPDGDSANLVPTGTVFNKNNVGGLEWTWEGAPDFAQGWGYPSGKNANRRFMCENGMCKQVAPNESANTCMGGCDYCLMKNNNPPTDGDECLKYCCPDVKKQYNGFTYEYDSAGCGAVGVQQSTNYTPALKKVCPNVYTYGYEDKTSTFKCTNQASLLIQSCPNPDEFPSS